MPRGKTVTLKGEAAGEYIRAQNGVAPKTDDERALRVATIVHLYMRSEPAVAVALIKQVAKEGLEAAAKTCTARSRKTAAEARGA